MFKTPQKTTLLIAVVLLLIGCLFALEVDLGKFYTGTILLEKGKTYLLGKEDIPVELANEKHLAAAPDKMLLLLAPQAALDSLGISLSPGDTLRVRGYLKNSMLRVNALKKGEKFWNLYELGLQGQKWHQKSSYQIARPQCIGCRLCVSKCPVEAIKMDKGKAVIDQSKCIECGICSDGFQAWNGCPVGAIKHPVKTSSGR